MKTPLTFAAALLLLVSMAATADLRMAIDDLIALEDYSQAMVLIDSHLADNPGDAAVRLRKAQILRWQGSLDAALQEYDALHERYPDDVDYLFGRAQVLLLKNQSQPALRDARRAAELAPDYEDVWILYYRLLASQPGEAAAGEMQQVREHAAARFAASTWWISRAVEETYSWTLRGGGSIEHLSDGLAGWNTVFAAAQYTSSQDSQYVATVSRDERFGTFDVQVSLSADWKLSNDWFAGTRIAKTFDADFLPVTEFTLHGGRPIGKGWVVDANFRRRSYENDRVDTLGSTVEYYFDRFRAAWSIGFSELNGDTTSVSQALYFNWYVNDSMSFGAAVNYGDEAELIAPGQVLKTRVSGFAVTGRHTLNSRLSLDWWLGMQDQGDFYRRQYAGMAFSIGI